MRSYSPAIDRAQTIRRAGWWVASLFWIVQFVELSIVGAVEGGQKAVALLLPRGVVVASGMLLSLPIIEIAVRTDHRAFRVRLVSTITTALLMCFALMCVNYGVFLLWQLPGGETFNLVGFIYSGFGWSWFFLGITGAVVGFSYSLEARARDQHLAVLELVARDARLATLRYQINPHFLFNTLNSIAALIHDQSSVAAERMTESLAEFLRATLDMDPVRGIRLSREIELQSLYLGMEEVRFPDRLKSVFKIDEAAAAGVVPALILQPLVENAIVHGVSRSMMPVTVTLKAYVSGERLHVVVENDSPPSVGAAVMRAGVGLKNVADRLRISFGSDQSFSAAHVGGTYRVHLQMPYSLEVAP